MQKYKPKKEYMDMAISAAYAGIAMKHGGPFGAVIIDKDDNVIAVAHNTVLRDNDPTCHGEINAIRDACKELGTYDLTGCILYTTAYPCPMCLCAMMWANITKIYYGCTEDDTGDIGFRDDDMYDIIHLDDYKMQSNDETKWLEEYQRNKCLKLFKKYDSEEHKLY